MKNIHLKKIIKTLVCLAVILVAGTYSNFVLAYSPPVVNAGANQYITSNQYNGTQTTVLQGSAYDPNGGSLNYSWYCTGGSLSNPNIAEPIYTAPYALTSSNSYACTLTATDNYGLSASGSMTVFVNTSSTTPSNISVQTNAATDYTLTQAILNGYLYLNNSAANSAWFQWGTSTSYGSQSFPQTIDYSGAFSQPIGDLISNTTYHFRAVALQSNGQIVYGQDLTFFTNPNTQNGQTYYNNSTLVNITKQAIDLTSGNLTWSNDISASPQDILKFQITIEPIANQTLTNVVVKDALPPNLIYDNSLIVSGANYYGNITSGLSLGTLLPNQTVTISYQAQVAGAANFPYGASILTNAVSLQSDETGLNNATSNVTISVDRNSVLGASTNVSTGLTNNLFTDSFFLPFLLIMLGIWAYNSEILDFKKRDKK